MFADMGGQPGCGIDGYNEFFGITAAINAVRTGSLGHGHTLNKK
jgi:hypothetical protein